MSSQESVDLSQLSVASIFRYLRPAQLVAIGSILIAVISGAFGFGLWLGTTIEKPKQASLEIKLSQLSDENNKQMVENSELRSKIEKQRGKIVFLQTKERFLSLMTIHYQGYYPAWKEETKNSLERLSHETREPLFRFVMDIVRKSESGEAGPSVHARLGKGMEPTLKFEFDETLWRLPPDMFTPLL
jgi:hypothetical protein